MAGSGSSEGGWIFLCFSDPAMQLVRRVFLTARGSFCQRALKERRRSSASESCPRTQRSG
eukprot:756027-Hanusia_phi.AAC.1